MKKYRINGLDEKSFLKKYFHVQESVREFGLEWKNLVKMFDDYQANILTLEDLAKNEYQELRNIEGAYLVKYRVKNPEHFIDKVIRKAIDGDTNITIDNYLERFNDLIGFRILHLFKNNWESIHKQICEKYDLNETPVVYYRMGDSEEFLSHCSQLGIEPREKKAGYRSIHYVIKKPTLGRAITCEIQVRTVIEDAWSEIDHLVRYPNNTENDLLNRYLLLFNTLAGSADEMGTFLIHLKQVLLLEKECHKKKEESLNDTIAELKTEISKLKNLNGEQKEKINSLMTELDKKSSSRSAAITSAALADNSYWQYALQGYLGTPALHYAVDEAKPLSDTVLLSGLLKTYPESPQYLDGIHKFVDPHVGMPYYDSNVIHPLATMKTGDICRVDIKDSKEKK